MMLSARAQAFDEGGLAYTITNSISPFTVQVTGRASGNSATEISIPDTVTSNEITYSVTTIADSAFSSNALISVTIADSVTTIGNQAFAFNNALASVTIGSSVNTIGTQAFYFNALTSLTISDSVTTIGDQAFAFNNTLTSLTIGSSVTTIGYAAFYDNELISLALPDSVETIGDYAFAANNLTSLTIPDSVTTIGDWAFETNNLTSVTFLGNFGAFNLNMFTGNSNLTTITYVQGKTDWPQTFTPAGSGSVTTTSLPTTPQITDIESDDQKVLIRVSVASNGGSSITRYDATCSDGTNSFAGTSSSSLITVSGLTNGVAYTCTVTATNGVGTSTASSASAAVTPEEIIPSGLPIWLLYEATQSG